MATCFCLLFRFDGHFFLFVVQVYHDSMAGQKYMQYYKVEGWPYVAFIDPVTGKSLILLQVNH